MGQITLCKAVAVITLASLVAQPRVLIILPLLERGGTGILIAVMLLAILALALASIIGMWRGRWWGFLAFYGYAVTSTLMLGSALIPFVIGLVAPEARVVGVIALNGVALVGVPSYTGGTLNRLAAACDGPSERTVGSPAIFERRTGEDFHGR